MDIFKQQSQVELNSSLVVQGEFDLEEKKREVEEKIKNSPEILGLARQINLNDLNTVMQFGAPAATEISKFADKILHSMETSKTEDSGTMFKQLNKIMEKFDVKDFEEKQPGFMEKLFKKAQDSVETLFKKYHTMGDEVDKIFVTLRRFEQEIIKSNADLDGLFEQNMFYYEQLEKYIYAGEAALNEIRTEIIPQLEDKAANGEQIDHVNLNHMRQVAEMVDQRIYDLKLAENIALQSMPTIKSIQYGNYNLSRKINSAFIVTMPIFKQCLANAIMLKRQAVQAKSIQALDEKTKELLIRNAENTALQTKATAKMASGSFVDIETLEHTWQIIMNGIEETKQIQDEMRQKRIDGSKRLEEMKSQFAEKAKNSN